MFKELRIDIYFKNGSCIFNNHVKSINWCNNTLFVRTSRRKSWTYVLSEIDHLIFNVK